MFFHDCIEVRHWQARASLVARLVKNLPASVGASRDVGSIPGLRRSPEEGNGNLLQYSCLKIPWMEVEKSWV